MSLTAAQERTLEALRAFAASGSYYDPHPADARIIVAAQGYHRAVAVTTDGVPFKDTAAALAHQTSL